MFNELPFQLFDTFFSKDSPSMLLVKLHENTPELKRITSLLTYHLNL